MRLVGEQPEVAPLLGELDVLVVPSIQGEVQPTVVLEALAAGVPALVRREIYEEAYAELPVSTYATPDGLASALQRPRRSQTPTSELRRRFGPEQAISAIEAAARRAEQPT